MKKCSKCGAPRDGDKCKPCRAVYMRVWNQKNREARLAKWKETRLIDRRCKCGGVAKRGQPYCRSCNNAYKKEWNRKHPEVVKHNYQKGRLHDRACPRCEDGIALRGHSYCQPCHNAYNREQRLNNPDLQSERHKKLTAWRRAHPQHVAAQNSRRRALKRGCSEHFTAAEWKAIIKRQGGKCAKCAAVCKLTVDHIKALSRGGTDTAQNIQGLCWPCNARKNNR